MVSPSEERCHLAHPQLYDCPPNSHVFWYGAQEKDTSTLRQWEQVHGITKQGDLWTKEGALIVVGNNELKRGVTLLQALKARRWRRGFDY